MKRISTLLASLLLCIIGATVASAQSESGTTWEVSEDFTTEVHDGMYVVLQAGTNNNYSNGGYLNPSGKFAANIDPTCIYMLKQVDTVDDVAIYVLQNVSNKQYLYSEGYTLSYNDAFQFSCEVSEIASADPRKKIGGEDRNQIGAEGNTMVLCSKERNSSNLFVYLGYVTCPSFYTYSDTNDWFIYEATAREATSREKFNDAFNEFFKEGFDPSYYPVGSNPGCISQELYDQISSIFEEANEAIYNDNLTDAEIDDLTARLNAIRKAYLEGIIRVQPGKYYAFVSQRTQDMVYEDGSNNLMATAELSSLPEILTMDEANYIFKIEDAGEGYYYVQNFGTGNYWSASSGKSKQWKTQASAANKFYFPTYNANKFNIRHANGAYMHIDGGYKMVQWDSPTNTGNQYIIQAVDDAQVANLVATIEKQQFVKKYQSYYAGVLAVPGMYKYASGLTLDGNYAATGAGLVAAAQASTNAQQAGEGPLADAFDGNLQTYFVSKWSGAVFDEDYDWIQVDMGKEVQNLAVKFSMRHNHNLSDPREIALVAPAEGEALDGRWSDTIYRDTVIYQYSTPYAAGVRDSSTCIILKKLDRPVQNLRFAVIQTTANSIRADLGPNFYVSELRFYDHDGSINPRYALIPEAVRQELDKQMAASAAMLADSVAMNTATEDLEAGYAALEAAVDAFLAAYPDDQRLTSLIDKAYQQTEAQGMEGDGWGYFQAGAQEALKADLDAIKTAIEGKTLSLDDIAKYEAAVKAAVKTFNGKLNVPADGTLVRIVGAALDSNGEPVNSNGHYVYATDADTLNNIKWGYDPEDEERDLRLNAIWQYIHLEDGKCALRNLGTGRYLSNIYKNAASSADVDRTLGVKSVNQPEPLTAISSKTPGVFNFELIDGRYINGDPNGSIVVWVSTGFNSNFTIAPVDVETAGTDYLIPVKTGMTQIVTLPFTISYADPSAYKVLGVKDGELQLQRYDETIESIPAGTPFIVNVGEDLTDMYVGIDGADLSDFAANTTYEYGHIEQNGLIGTLNRLSLSANLGVLIDSVVKRSVANYAIPAGSGYFKYINETTEDGDLSIAIEEMPDGIGSISLNPATKRAEGIYTISGVRVNGKNLPKGVYIINGEKVVK